MPSTPHNPLYQSAPAVAVLDQNFNMTLSWTPSAATLPTLVPGPYSAYNHWDISTQIGANPVITAAFPTPAYAGGSLTYTQILAAGTVSLTMQAFSSADDSVFLTGIVPPYGGWLTTGSALFRQFPDAISGTNIAFSLTSVLLNQPLTVTLASAYATQLGNTANQWQVLWPDGTSTGWLPLSANVVTKQFTTPGSENVVIQTRASFAGSQYNPPTTLIRQYTQQVLVVNQQASSSSSSSGGLTGSLGIGGQQGFEIVGTTGASVTPEPWEVIVRCIVRDTITNELKLLIGTSRFSNASSLYGTMAVDVFPMEGRPHAKELIAPPYQLTVTSQTESVPVAIATSTLPTLIVGKSVTEAIGGTFQMAVAASSGIAPFIWSSEGLPDGLTLNGSGVLGGTPLELGTFQVTFTVQDSSVPFSVAETTLPLIVETDLLVEIAANQTDARGTVLVPLGTSLGVAQVNNPYSVQMQVGNINPSVSTPGGLPPYTWSIPAGALPIGLAINPSTGLISGSPSTYNSTTDFNTIFSATVQVTDAIGAKATQTYTMTLIPAVLQYGALDQGTIFAAQQFKLVVPVFGGASPYTLVSVVPLAVGDDPYYTLPATPVDGQIEIDVNFPQTATGQHSFQITVHDSASPTPAVATAQFSFNVENQISDPFLVPAFLDHVWSGPTDAAKPTPLALTGNLSGFSLAGLNVGVNMVAPSAGAGVYTDTGATCSFGGGAGNAYAGLTFAVSGFSNAVNNGTFLCSASSASTLTLANPNAAAETLTVAPVLTQATPVLGSLANPSAPFQDLTVYTGAITGGAGNFFAGQQFTVAGFVNAGNNGTFYCVQSTATTLSLASASGVLETHAGTATQTTAKALQVNTLSSTNPLTNGITVAIDPSIPEVEFSGPPSGIFGNQQYTVPVQLQFGGATQAVVSQTYTVQAANNSSPFLPTDIGAIAATTRPYLYGAGLNELVGLNPRKPWYNSSNIPAITPFPPPLDAPWIATVATGSALPPGLNLDANTGLIYGNLVGPFSSRSVVQYVGSTGTVHGAATITWASPSVPSSFQLIDNIQDGLPLGSAYPATSYIAVPAGTTPASANLFGPSRLPAGLLSVFTVSGQNILITGTPSEAGYFDTWFQVVATNGQSAFLRHRFSIDFLPPLTIVTTTLPDISDAFYGPFTVQAIGGVPNALGQYQWSLGTLPAGAAGLVISPTTGQISGTLPPVSRPIVPTLFAIPVVVTDYSPSGVIGAGNVTTGATISIQYDNALRITTAEIATVVPASLDPLGSGEFSFQMQAAGGTPPYSWEITPAANLPTGITPVNSTSWNGAFVAQGSGGGLFGGTYTGLSALTFPINVTVKDSVPNTFGPVAFNVETGPYILSINTSGAGVIVRGVPYQGTLSCAGLCTQPPVQWEVAPTPAWPLGLPSGLSLTVNGSGVTATISGTYSGPTLTGSGGLNPYQVRIIAVDSADAPVDTGVVLLPLVTGTNLTVAGWQTVTPPSATLAFPLPHAFIATPGGWAYNGAYSGGIQLIATGGVAPFTWAVTPAITGAPYNLALSTGGLLTNVNAGSFSNAPFTFMVTDSIGNTASLLLDLSSQASGLAITTSAIGAFLAGTAYTTSSEPSGLPLAATLGTPPYTFSVSPLNANPLPTGLTLTSGGYITGTTIQGGYSKPVTFRVTDSIGSYSDKVLTVSVTAVLHLFTGIDYTDCTATNSLGYVDLGNVSSVNPRPNLSFYVVATGVVSTSPATITVTTSNASITGTVVSLGAVIPPCGPNVATQTAKIALTGPFALGVAGTYPLSVTVVDSGISITGVFNWVVYGDGTLSLAPSSGTLPTQAIG